jgi:hypothetical protein
MGQDGNQPADFYTYFYWNEHANLQLGTEYFIHQRIRATITNRIIYIILRGRLCDTIALNVQPQTEDKCDNIKNRFYKELERVLDQFPKYHMKILSGDINANVWKEDIFKLTI